MNNAQEDSNWILQTLTRRYSAAECLDGVIHAIGILIMAMTVVLASGSAQNRIRFMHYTVVIEQPAATRSIRDLAGRWTPIVVASAHRYGLPPQIVASVLHEENRGYIPRCARRVSRAGAIGPMQLMPMTANEVLHVDAWNPRQNIAGGARYLAQLLRRYQGNARAALVAYNEGPTAFDRGQLPRASITYANDVIRRAQAAGWTTASPEVMHGALAMSAGVK